MGKCMKSKVLLTVILLSAGSTCAAAAVGMTAVQQETLMQASQKVQQGNNQAAYQTLLPLESELAGNPEYDRALGQAALGAKHPTHALMAFDRCLAVMPKNGLCRLGVAQAHIMLDEKQSAETQLNIIKRSAPPQQVAEAVERYLGELSGATATTRKTQPFKVWAELALGHDNNINVAPTSSAITLPGIGILAGTFESKKDKSSFGQVKLGASWQQPISTHWNVLAGANLQGTRNFQAEDDSFFDRSEQLGANVGLSGRYDRHRIGVMAQGQNYRLGGENYRNLAGLSGQYGYLLNPTTQLSGFLQYNQLNYQYGSDANLQNVDSVILGGSVAHAPHRDWVLFGGFYTGQDSKAESKASDTIESDYLGLRAGATWLFRPDWQANLNLTYENRDYGGSNTLLGGLPVYNYSRTDKQLSTSLGLDWKVLQNLTVKAQFSHVNNDSNVAVREYKRQIINLGVRYDFF